MTARRATALVVALAAVAAGCAKDQATSVLLQVANGAGVPRPSQVTIDIYAPGDADQLGPPLKSFPGLVPQSGDGVLGTLVIYPGANLTGLTIRAQGLVGGEVSSQGSIDVAIVPGRQTTAVITLAAETRRDAGAETGAPGDGSDAPTDDGGAPDGDGGTPPGDAGNADADAGGSGDAGRDLAGDQAGSPPDASADGAPPDGTAPTTVISVDFLGMGTAMAASEQAGVVPASHWTSAPGGIGSLVALVDGNGIATTGSMTWTAGASTNIFMSGIPDVAGNNRMMNGYLDPTNGATITVNNLPSVLAVPGYDVYVYTNGAVPAGETRTFNYAIGTATFSLTETTAQVFSGTFVMAPATAGGSGNYVVFRGIRGTTFTVTATPGASTSMFMRAPVNGLQIVGR